MNSCVAQRKYWIDTMKRIADPVLNALKERRLKKDMPVEQSGKDREKYTHLEALGRLLAGIAPWLTVSGIEIEEEKKLQSDYAVLAREAIDAGTDPDSPDLMNFSDGYQPIVDAAFLSHAVLRAKSELWDKLEGRVRKNLIACLKSTRSHKPFFCNWLLFSAMTETLLYTVREEWDPMRIDYALKQHEQWYLGDGIYGDGPDFHWDYYNSFVIHPMISDIIAVVYRENDEWGSLKNKITGRVRRYASIQERLISPEGSFPVIGRSIAYRMGAFQLLGQAALQHKLPKDIPPAQVRCAMTAMMLRIMEAPGTFDDKGWLKIGLYGSQPGLAEDYISTGSLYLCATGLLPLGLPPEDVFWSGKDCDWTSKKIWDGRDLKADHAL